MKKILSLLALWPMLLASCNTQHQPTEEDMGAYLFTYFSDPTHSLFMAISYDGYTFTPLNGGEPVIGGDSIADQRGIRDPHIYRSPNGKFYIAMTDLHVFGKEKGLRDTQWERPDKYGWGNNRGLVLMASDDLIHWTHHEARIDQLFPEKFGELGCAWAPQTIWDPEVGKPMVYFTIRQNPGGRTKLYYSYADEAFTTLETEPQLLFEYPDTTIQVLDADICPMPDGRYFMSYVAQENPGGIKYMISDRINHYEDYVDEQIDGENRGCEAPNVWKRIGEDKWVIMYDIYSVNPHNFGFVETSDFKTFTPLGRFNEGVLKMKNFTSPKHGSVIHITLDEAKRLENYWSEKYCSRYARTNVPTDSIRLSDPAILADSASHTYYMTGTSGLMWRSTDLKLWDGPFRVTEFDSDSWMGAHPMIWASELHRNPGDNYYYYFATFTNSAVKIDTVRGNVIERRASQVLRADNPMGPYRAFGDSTYLPADRPTLDGTFWRDTDGKPYMVFCGEWLQNWNGTMEKIELKPDLSGTVGEPQVLFRASDSPWSREKDDKGNVTWNKVTDGPWLFRTGTGRLGMLWTSWVFGDYTQGVAYSESGTLDGPWIQEPEPITPPNFGHSMLFQRFDGQWMMSVHSHAHDENGRTVRIPHFFEVDLSGDKLVVKTEN